MAGGDLGVAKTDNSLPTKGKVDYLTNSVYGAFLRFFTQSSRPAGLGMAS